MPYTAASSECPRGETSSWHSDLAARKPHSSCYQPNHHWVCRLVLALLLLVCGQVVQHCAEVGTCLTYLATTHKLFSSLLHARVSSSVKPKGVRSLGSAQCLNAVTPLCLTEWTAGGGTTFCCHSTTTKTPTVLHTSAIWSVLS